MEEEVREANKMLHESRISIELLELSVDDLKAGRDATDSEIRAMADDARAGGVAANVMEFFRNI